MIETEIERTYLASALPEDLASHPHYKMTDIYFPAETVHPQMRIRQKGDTYTLTKKTKVAASDASMQTEENISLNREEFEALRAGHGKTVSKIRYNVPVGDHTAEIDVFTDDLSGLVLVDFEFDSAAARDAFIKPDWCGTDVTQEDVTAGGMLAGKKLADIATDLQRLGHTPLTTP